MEWTLVADYSFDISKNPSEETITNLSNKLSSFEDCCLFYIKNITEDGQEIIGLSDEVIDSIASKYGTENNTESNRSDFDLRLISGKTIDNKVCTNGFWIYGIGTQHEPINVDGKAFYPIGLIYGSNIELPRDAIIVNRENFDLFKTGGVSVHCIFKKRLTPDNEELFISSIQELIGGVNGKVEAPYEYRFEKQQAGVGYTRMLTGLILFLSLIGCVAIFLYGTKDFYKNLRICYECGMTRTQGLTSYLILFLVYMALGLLIQLPVGLMITK